MRTKALIISCFIVVLLTISCAASSSSEEYEESTLPVSDKKNTESEENNSSDSVASPINDNYSFIPDFLSGYFDYGTYNAPSRIPNPGQYDKISISADNTLDFPELSVLAIVIDKWGSPPYLLEQDDVKIGRLFDLLKEVEIQKEDSTSERRLESEQDSQISLVLLTGSAKYALVVLRSFKDGFVDIHIQQENMNDAILLSTKAEMVHDYMRAICGVQNGDIQFLMNAVNIMYLSKDDKWITLPSSQVVELQSLTGEMAKITNYSTGCPFELKLVIETNEEKYDAAISTDSCGIVIIGDQTYQIDKEQRGTLRTIFEDVPWEGD